MSRFAVRTAIEGGAATGCCTGAFVPGSSVELAVGRGECVDLYSLERDEATGCAAAGSKLYHEASLPVSETVQDLATMTVRGPAARALCGAEALDTVAVLMPGPRVALVAYDWVTKGARTVDLIDCSRQTMRRDLQVLHADETPTVPPSPSKRLRRRFVKDPAGRCLAVSVTERAFAVFTLSGPGDAARAGDGPAGDGAPAESGEDEVDADAEAEGAFLVERSLPDTGLSVSAGERTASALGEPFVVAAEACGLGPDRVVVDAAFLDTRDDRDGMPWLALLHTRRGASTERVAQDRSPAAVLVVRLDTRERAPVERVWATNRLPVDAFALVACPAPHGGGVMLLAASSVTYLDGTRRTALPVNGFAYALNPDTEFHAEAAAAELRRRGVLPAHALNLADAEMAFVSPREALLVTATSGCLALRLDAAAGEEEEGGAQSNGEGGGGGGGGGRAQEGGMDEEDGKEEEEEGGGVRQPASTGVRLSLRTVGAVVPPAAPPQLVTRDTALLLSVEGDGLLLQLQMATAPVPDGEEAEEAPAAKRARLAGGQGKRTEEGEEGESGNGKEEEEEEGEEARISRARVREVVPCFAPAAGVAVGEAPLGGPARSAIGSTTAAEAAANSHGGAAAASDGGDVRGAGMPADVALCTGGARGGALRVVTRGVRPHVLARSRAERSEDAWSLRVGEGQPPLLVVGAPGQPVVHRVGARGLESVPQAGGLQRGPATLLVAGSGATQCCVQVTKDCVRAMPLSALYAAAHAPPAEARLRAPLAAPGLASWHDDVAVVAASGACAGAAVFALLLLGDGSLRLARAAVADSSQEGSAAGTPSLTVTAPHLLPCAGAVTAASLYAPASAAEAAVAARCFGQAAPLYAVVARAHGRVEAYALPAWDAVFAAPSGAAGPAVMLDERRVVAARADSFCEGARRGPCPEAAVPGGASGETVPQPPPLTDPDLRAAPAQLSAVSLFVAGPAVAEEGEEAAPAPSPDAPTALRLVLAGQSNVGDLILYEAAPPALPAPAHRVPHVPSDAVHTARIDVAAAAREVPAAVGDGLRFLRAPHRVLARTQAAFRRVAIARVPSGVAVRKAWAALEQGEALPRSTLAALRMQPLKPVFHPFRNASGHSGAFVAAAAAAWVLAVRGRVLLLPMSVEPPTAGKAVRSRQLAPYAACAPVQARCCDRGLALVRRGGDVLLCAIPRQLGLVPSSAPDCTSHRVHLRGAPRAVAYLGDASRAAGDVAAPPVYAVAVGEQEALSQEARTAELKVRLQFEEAFRAQHVGRPPGQQPPSHEQDVIAPDGLGDPPLPLERHRLRLIAGGAGSAAWKAVCEDVVLPEREQVTSLSVVWLAQRQGARKSPYLCVTSYEQEPRGPEAVVGGRIRLYEIKHVRTADGGPAQCKLGPAAVKQEPGGPVHAACAVAEDAILYSVGRKLVVAAWNGAQLVWRAFWDGPAAMHALRVVRHFVIALDAYQGVHFLRYRRDREGTRELVELARDALPCPALAVAPILHHAQLGIAVSDVTGNVRVLRFSMRDAAARGGKQLVPAADAFLGARTAAMSAVSLTEVASANEGFQGRRHAALCAGVDGRLTSVMPLDDTTYSLLSKVQAALGRAVLPVAGVQIGHRRRFRYEAHVHRLPYESRGNVLDLDCVLLLLHLSRPEQTAVCDAAGVQLSDVMNALIDLDLSASAV